MNKLCGFFFCLSAVKFKNSNTSIDICCAGVFNLWANIMRPTTVSVGLEMWLAVSGEND